MNNILGFVTELISALRDGKISSDEAARLLSTLVEMVPSDDLMERAGDAIADALYRDSVELRAAALAKRRRSRALTARKRHPKRAKRLLVEASRMEALATQRESDPYDAEQAARSRQQLAPKPTLRPPSAKVQVPPSKP